MKRRLEDEWILREILERLYFEEKHSLRTIARILNVHQRTVWGWFEKFGIPRRPMSDAVSLAKSSIYNRPFDPTMDENTVIELNALCHTDFTPERRYRKIRIGSMTTHIGQVHFFNKIAISHNLMPARCAPVYCKDKKWPLHYGWLIYISLDETFKEVINDDKIRYPENLKNDKESLLLYFTRIVECDGWITIKKNSLRIYAYIGFGQKDHQYVQKLTKIISETFNVPVNYDYCERTDITKLSLPVMDKRVADLLRKMPIMHPEKALKRDLALRYVREEATEDLLREINNARSAIRRLRDLTVELARERYLLDRRERVMTADELVDEVLRRYAERHNDYDIE